MSNTVYAANIAEYRVTVSPDLDTAHISATLPSGHSIKALRAYSDEAWDRLDLGSLENLSAAKSGLQVQAGRRKFGYSVDISASFKRWLLGSLLTEGSTHITDLRDWFWVPDQWNSSDTIVVEFEMPDGYTVSAPWEPLRIHGSHQRFRARPFLLDRRSTLAFGQFDFEQLSLQGGHVTIAMATEDRSDQRRYSEWIADVASVAVQVFGQLPAPSTQILLMPTWFSNDPTPLGEVRRGGGTALVLVVQNDASPSALREDWTLYHEFSHLFHPYLGSEGRWLAEGLASYYQNVLLARGGIVSPAIAWQSLTAGFARGAGETTPGQTVDEAGLMRMYWTGAVMALELDMRLREQSGGSETLDSALGGFSKCCLPSTTEWSPIDFMRKLDEIAATDLFVRTYAKYSTETNFPDYDALLTELAIDPITGGGNSAMGNSIMGALLP